jgi:NADH-quinone oxidoreductase subunit M
MENNLLSFIIFFPLVAMLLLWLIPARQRKLLLWSALGLSVIEFVVSLQLLTRFPAGVDHNFRFVEHYDWIPNLGISYHLGVDGISLFLVLLTTFLIPICILAGWDAVRERLRGYLMMFFLLEAGIVGNFLALDLVLFYLFWELMLIPMYFLIGLWGGENRVYAAVKFFIYTMVGSLLMLVAILYVYWHTIDPATGRNTFDLLIAWQQFSALPAIQYWLFGAFGLAFAIKVPLFPLHTWLPDAHVEAPTAGSIILAGVLLKMGTYGFLRFSLPLFPEATVKLAPVLLVLAVIGIVYGALISIIQKDMKKLVAYSSVSHLGFVVLGIFILNPIALTGSLIQMISHGLSTGALFLAVGVIYERTHTRKIADMGGLARVMPIYAVILMVVMLSSVGLPGLNGFVGEFLILLGTFQVMPWVAVFAALGVIFAAVYLLWMYQRVMFGPVTNPKNEKLLDMNGREVAMFLPLLLFIVWIGVYPGTFLSRMEGAITHLLAMVQVF